MRHRIPSLLLVLLVCGGSAGAASDSATVTPLAFESNEGHWPSELRFVARSRDGMVAVDARGAIHLLGQRRLRMTLAGAQAPAEIRGEERLKQTHHYFTGRQPSFWRNDIPTYGRVLCRDVYRGIDLVLRSGENGDLEYDFVVHPGADPRKIRMRFHGAKGVSIGRSGELVLRTDGAAVRMKPPVLFQLRAEGSSLVSGNYRLLGRNTVGFVVGSYDPLRPLVIDPVVVGYSTFLGGSDHDIVTALVVDGDRNTWVAGSTLSTTFPAQGASRTATPGARDAFVAKVNAAGDQVLAVTFVGGRGNDAANAVAVDTQGNVYLTGNTASSDFPVTPTAPQPVSGGGEEAFVVKLSRDGSRLLFATYLGGEADDSGRGIAADALGNIHVTGWTRSDRFPTTSSALQKGRRGMRDGFVTKYSVDPASVLLSTYVGGSDEEVPRGLAVDAAGNTYITGNTFSADYPTTEGAVQTTFGGAGSGNQRFGDVFVTTIRAQGDAFGYSTYIGGANGEIGDAVSVDATGAAHIAGIAFFSGFPTTQGAYQTRPAGGQADAFVLKLAPAGDRLLFSTYLGGREDSGNEEAFAIASDALGNVHVAGSTLSSDFPTTEDAVSRQKQGLIDAFVSILNADGTRLLYSSFIGGTAPSGAPQDNGFAIAVDGGGNTYIGGQTRSRDFPVTAKAVQATYGGGDDAFLMKLTPQRERPEGEMRIVPVAGSTPGALGSYFKTSFQLHNPRSTTISGRFVFHRLGVSGSAADPSLDYYIRPGETVAFSDLLPAMGESGLGSVDLFVPPGEAPESFIRIFNDAGDAGTTGMSLEPMRPEDALGAGMTGVLIAPISDKSRFNVGVRSLEEGASLTITVRRADGTIAHTATRTYERDFFEQRSAAEFAGAALAPDDSIAVRVDAGSAVIYGSATDNITQDPSLQILQPGGLIAGETRIVPVVGSTPGVFGSFFRTSVQLHNPGSQPIHGRLVYHPQNVSGSDADASLPYTIEAGQTISFSDLLPAMGLSGLGSVDMVSESGPLPVSLIRIYNDAGERGTSGMTEEPIPIAAVLGEGDEGILIAPADPAKARCNIGIRTLGEGATVTATLRTSHGTEVKSVTRVFDPVFFTQMPAGVLMEAELRGNDSIRLRIDKGRAVIYAATTDNLTQDPALKIVRRLP